MAQIGFIKDNIQYSANFSWVFNFANFVNFQPFVKVFQRKFLTCESLFSCSGCRSIEGQHPGAVLLNEIFKTRFPRRFRPSKIKCYTVQPSMVLTSEDSNISHRPVTPAFSSLLLVVSNHKRSVHGMIYSEHTSFAHIPCPASSG